MRPHVHTLLLLAQIVAPFAHAEAPLSAGESEELTRTSSHRVIPAQYEHGAEEEGALWQPRAFEAYPEDPPNFVCADRFIRIWLLSGGIFFLSIVVRSVWGV